MGILTRTHGMGVAALLLGASVFLSRILGLVRDKVISYYFGAGSEADVYFTAFTVPDFLNYLLAGGYFSITLVPMLARAFTDDEEDGKRFFSSAVAWAFIAVVLLTLVAWCAAPALTRLAAPGFSPEQGERLQLFLRIILPAQVCFLPGACFTAMLYYRRQFTIPALTPLVYNGGIIGAGLIGVYCFPAAGMQGFCWGVPIGAFAGSLLLPIAAVRAGGMPFAFKRINLRHPLMKRLLFLALPLMLGQSIVVLDEQFVRIFGSLTGEGGVSLLNYARRIMLVPVGVVAQAAGLASYPFLAAAAAAHDRQGFDNALNKALTATVLAALPLSLWMMTAAEPIMRLIFQQGGFTAQDATASGLFLAVMLAGVAFWAVQQILGRAFYAHQDTLTPALAGSAATLLSLPLYWYGARHFGAAGVAVAGTFGVVLYASALWVLRQRRFGGGGTAGVASAAAGSFFYCLPACAAAYAAACGVGRLFAPESLFGAFLRISVGGVLFAVVYLGLTVRFHPRLSEPIVDFARKALRKIR